MKFKTALMWMGTGMFVGSMYEKNKKEMNQMMNKLGNRAYKKTMKMVSKM